MEVSSYNFLHEYHQHFGRGRRGPSMPRAAGIHPCLSSSPRCLASTPVPYGILSSPHRQAHRRENTEQRRVQHTGSLTSDSFSPPPLFSDFPRIRRCFSCFYICIPHKAWKKPICAYIHLSLFNLIRCCKQQDTKIDNENNNAPADLKCAVSCSFPTPPTLSMYF